MIASAVGELGGSDIYDTLLSTVGYLVNEAQDILVGITEAHAAADTGLEIGSGT